MPVGKQRSEASGSKKGDTQRNRRQTVARRQVPRPERTVQGGGRAELTAPGADDYVRRRVVFVMLVAVVFGTGAMVLLPSLRPSGGPTLAKGSKVPAPYTVKLMEVRGADRMAAEEVIKRPVVKKLAKHHELFLARIGDDRLALCAGRFTSPNSPQLRDLLEEFQQVFRKACVFRSPE